MPKNNFYLLLFIILGFIIFNTYILNQMVKNKETTIIQSKVNDEQETIHKYIDINELPIRQFLENRDRSILYDPLKAPERRVDVNQYPRTIKNYINIPTRGYPDNYQLMGILHRDSDEKILQLFGRATFPGSNQYEYYVTTEQYGFQNKIPIANKGNKEFYDNDIIEVPIFDKSKGPFKISLYNYDTPRYNPYVY